MTPRKFYEADGQGHGGYVNMEGNSLRSDNPTPPVGGKERTAMQTVYAKMKLMPSPTALFNWLENNKTELLELEKNKISVAWTIGWNDRGNDDGDYSAHEDGEQYYCKTYGKL